MKRSLALLILMTGCAPPPVPTTPVAERAVNPCQEQFQTLQTIGRVLAVAPEIDQDDAVSNRPEAIEARERRLAQFLLTENLLLEQAQSAFDRLTTCRLRQAESIRASLTSGEIDQPHAITAMSIAHASCGFDLRMAKQVARLADERSQRKVAAAEPQPVPPPVADVIAAPVPMQISPNPDSPVIGRVLANEQVMISNARNGYVLAKSLRGMSGFVPMTMIHQANAIKPVFAGSEVQTLAGSNAARRDDFATSVSVMEYTASHSGFELSPEI